MGYSIHNLFGYVGFVSFAFSLFAFYLAMKLILLPFGIDFDEYLQ